MNENQSQEQTIRQLQNQVAAMQRDMALYKQFLRVSGNKIYTNKQIAMVDGAKLRIADEAVNKGGTYQSNPYNCIEFNHFAKNLAGDPVYNHFRLGFKTGNSEVLEKFYIDNNIETIINSDYTRNIVIDYCEQDIGGNVIPLSKKRVAEFTKSGLTIPALTLTNLTANPANPTGNVRVLASVNNVLKFWDGTSWKTVTLV